MRQQLVTRQTQNLSLTPELRQSLRFLGLATNELVEELKDIALENPLLDLEEGANSDAEEAEAVKINESTDPNELTLHEMASGTDYATHTMSSSGENDFTYDGSNSNEMATYVDFRQHLKEQLISNNTSDEDKELTTYLIDNLNEDGFLEETFEELKHNLPEGKKSGDIDFERCRNLLQNLEPVGVGSKDLIEHLQLQVRKTTASNHVKALSKTLLDQHLTLLASYNYKKLAHIMGCEIIDVEEAAKLISNLSPKPLSADWEDHARYVKPDLIAEKYNKNWMIRLNDAWIPRVGINQEYADLIQHGKEDASSPLKDYLKQARYIQRSINQRHETLLRVSKEIFKVQMDFLENGPKGLLPLTLQTISEALDLHESTISRATSGKYISTPRGTFELKYFFSTGIGDMGETSSTHVKDIIKRMIGSEDSKDPLSDSQIQKALYASGIEIARRTVAKYRENQNILPSQMRKRA